MVLLLSEENKIQIWWRHRGGMTSSNLEECIIFCIWLISETLENLFDAFVLFLFAV